MLLFHALFKRKPSFYEKYAPVLGYEIAENSLAISLKHRYVYTRIYKSANSTVVSSLYFHETGEYIDDVEGIQDIKDNYFVKPSRLSRRQVDELPDFFKFTIIRNPYARFLSCYFDKIKPVDKSQRKSVLDFFNRPDGSDISLEEFLIYLENGGIRTNGHWAPQSDFLVFPIMEYNKICYMESLQNDLTGILNEVYGSAEIVSIVDHKTDADSRVSGLGSMIKNRIRKLYWRDFDCSGY
jgi:hypothetical protein